VTVSGLKSRESVSPVAQTLRIDISLKSAQIRINHGQRGRALLKTESGELSHNEFTGMDQLPITDIGNLASTQRAEPAGRQPADSRTTSPGAGNLVRVNGAQKPPAPSVSGRDATNGYLDGFSQHPASVDAIRDLHPDQQFFGGFGQVGGLLQLLKSGSNQFHGSRYDYFVNEALGDSALRQHARGQRRKTTAALLASVGSPRVHDSRNKTFFFNWEQFRESQNYNNVFWRFHARVSGSNCRISTGKVLTTDSSAVRY
jgi:hypothetical protein